MDNAKKIVISITFVLFLITSVAYVTYAYFNASTGTNTNTQGSAYNAYFNVNISNTYKATKLIPVTETVLNATVNKSSNNCRDTASRDTCSLYQVTVSNGPTALSLKGFVKTISSTYTTSNLKYKVFTKSGSTYTAVTDAMTVNKTANAIVYFQKNSANYETSVAANGSQTYYIAFWINETNAAQNDMSKTYSFQVGFEGFNNTQLSTTFST